jgi:hypothetical protein
VQLLKGLGDIDSQTVLTALVGGREQADQVELKRAVGGLLYKVLV